MFWGKLITIILIVFCVWWLWRIYEASPEAFSKRHWGKSFSTMGVLALMLIAFVALIIFWLKS